MDFKGKKVLVLGGAGLVGQAICRRAADEETAELIICSLFEKEVKAFAAELEKEFSKLKISTEWGNIFVRNELKDIHHKELLENSDYRGIILSDILDPLNRDILTQSTIFNFLNSYKPDIVIDSINTATAVAYQNIYGVSKEAKNILDRSAEGGTTDEIRTAVEKLICTQYTPQLIRHVQIFLQSMAEAKTRFYLKIGTCGTGGMGLNIPYTHSEDKPSQMLLSKSAVAGGHSLLMFLMARTPGGPIIKELKPAAAIAWKRVAFGTIQKGGKDILLEDVTTDDAIPLKEHLKKGLDRSPTYIEENGRPKPLKAPFIDTGENGLFSRGEFEAITDEGQMEFITPEEIAQCAIWEIKGLNTGHDIVAALDNSILAPTYRAGYMRAGALSELRKLVAETGIDSIAFERLGPPRLSKLLYEGHLLSICFGTFKKTLETDPAEMSKRLADKITKDSELRSRIISIGIPILLPTGDKLLRGSQIAIPADIPGRPDVSFEITPEMIEKWAHDGWVDLRRNNMVKWQTRLKTIMAGVEAIPENNTSSAYAKGPHYWQDEKGNYPISISKLVSWIFINEDKGIRMK